MASVSWLGMAYDRGGCIRSDGSGSTGLVQAVIIFLSVIQEIQQLKSQKSSQWETEGEREEMLQKLQVTEGRLAGETPSRMAGLGTALHCLDWSIVMHH